MLEESEKDFEQIEHVYGFEPGNGTIAVLNWTSASSVTDLGRHSLNLYLIGFWLVIIFATMRAVKVFMMHRH